MYYVYLMWVDVREIVTLLSLTSLLHIGVWQLTIFVWHLYLKLVQNRAKIEELSLRKSFNINMLPLKQKKFAADLSIAWI